MLRTGVLYEMGMSASQARLLTITARLSDNELSAQSVQNAKIRLSSDTQSISTNYLNSLDSKVMKMNVVNDQGKLVYQDLSYALLMGYNKDQGGGYRLTDVFGRVLVPEEVAKAYNGSEGDLNKFMSSPTIVNELNKDPNAKEHRTNYYKDLFSQMQQSGTCAKPQALLNNNDYIQNQLKTGGLYLERYQLKDDGNYGYKSDSWQSGNNGITEVEDTRSRESIKAKYDVDLQKVQSKDKKFDLELKRLDTEHNALQTEYDSVKKVIDKNIESSFKIFG